MVARNEVERLVPSLNGETRNAVRAIFLTSGGFLGRVYYFESCMHKPSYISVFIFLSCQEFQHQLQILKGVRMDPSD